MSWCSIFGGDVPGAYAAGAGGADRCAHGRTLRDGTRAVADQVAVASSTAAAVGPPVRTVVGPRSVTSHRCGRGSRYVAGVVAERGVPGVLRRVHGVDAAWVRGASLGLTGLWWRQGT